MKYAIAIITLLILSNNSPSEIKIQEKERLCIAEAIKIAERYSSSLWKDFDKTPFTLLLVTDDYEFLIRHPNPSEDFTFLKYDPLLKSDIYYRDTKFSTGFLATFPAVNGINCIVVGTPENTGRNTSEWIITLLHEHFHQYVYNSSNYYKAVNTLDLANGDNTGMWMLNYPFPYQDEAVITAFKSYTSALKTLSLIDDKESSAFKTSYASYQKNRTNFKASISDKDYRYFSFQLWQEGISRYTEIKFLEEMHNYEVSASIKKLKDFVDFNYYLKALLKTETKKLESYHLAKNKRVCFYALGMAEGLILDKLKPNWRSNYLNEKFFLEKYQ